MRAEITGTKATQKAEAVTAKTPRLRISAYRGRCFSGIVDGVSEERGRRFRLIVDAVSA